MRTAVRVIDTLSKATLYAIMHGCFTPKELIKIGINEKDRLKIIKQLLQLGIIVKNGRGFYCVNGKWIGMFIFWASGRRLEPLVHEYLEEILLPGGEQI